jgi:hypothetical protein
VKLRTVADILGVLETAIGDALSRKPSLGRSRALGYLATVALKALEVGELEERLEALESRMPQEPRRTA